MNLRLPWTAVVVFLAACGVQRSGLGGLDGSRPDADRPDSGLMCPEGTVDLNGDPEDGCECAVSDGERCNAIDDDCDGTVDEEITDDPRLGGDCDGGDDDLCMDGVVECVGGEPSCVDEQDPENVEMCDDAAVDEDCDGDRNEDCSCTPGSEPLRCGPTSDMGICVFGSQDCVDGEWAACVGATLPEMETCDNRDEDCDGSTDEAVTQSCMNRCGTPGLQLCAAGTFGACDAPAEPMEVCDGMDNDCDGSTDEGVPDRACMNACGTSGTESCVRGRYRNCTAPAPPMETCNGNDDDCDGTTDETVRTQSCTDADCGRAGTQRCTGASGYGECIANDVSVESCNDRDDDCDGATDEESDGTCMNSCGDPGTRACVGGSLGACSEPDPPELCNGADDDCDGMIDEGVSSGGTETCNATDDDCDGIIDEGVSDCGSDCRIDPDPTDPLHVFLLCKGAGDRTDQATAQARCVSKGYHLVHIESEAEHALVWGFAQSFDGNRDWWIGVSYSGGNWEWTDGTNAYPSAAGGYDGWGPGFPGASTECGRMDDNLDPPTGLLSQGGWRAQTCSNNSRYICEAGD